MLDLQEEDLSSILTLATYYLGDLSQVTQLNSLDLYFPSGPVGVRMY